MEINKLILWNFIEIYIYIYGEEFFVVVKFIERSVLI